MNTQKFIIEITDVTGQFPLSADRLAKAIGDNLPFSHSISVKEE